MERKTPSKQNEIERKMNGNDNTGVFVRFLLVLNHKLIFIVVFLISLHSFHFIFNLLLLFLFCSEKLFTVHLNYTIWAHVATHNLCLR